MDERYDACAIEEKWQGWWEAHGTFRARETPGGRKYYVLEMFPYPSGRIHMGHVRNYSIGDVVARFRRMRGHEVIHPIGWDAFGLPAENAAIERGVHPASWTADNVAHMRRQLQRLGFSYDWTREVTTSDPDYYRWEQLFFIQMFERNLAYRRRSIVNWCPGCETVLANEQVVDGSCWRCDSRVDERDLEQWFLRITAYAEELLADCDRLTGWPERVLAMQRNWIGRSEGAEIRFPLAGGGGDLPVFTTRQDTVYGATFMSVAPEHPRLRDLARGTGQEAAVDAFVARVARQTRAERTEGKEGVFTGAHCENPFTGRRIPIYAANFVLTEYGTGAVMAVPAHDQRDFEFARRYELPVVAVVHPPGERLDGSSLTAAYEGPGVLAESGPFSGLDSETAKIRIVEHLEAKNLGGHRVQYRLRDWGISRQRYWGAPIPIIYCEACGTVPVPADQLPVRLPTEGVLWGRGGSPLARMPSFVNTQCPRCGDSARRETDTMDTFVESSWYFFRFAGPDADDGPWRPEGLRYWLPVDQYIGGIEHAVMHLLYARFFSKVLRDLGWVGSDVPHGEPFLNLLTQGMVTKGGAAMSKSRGNVVEPDPLIERYGADTVRLFSLFAAPPEKDLEWSDQGVEGAARFLGRVWRLVARCREARGTPPEGGLPREPRARGLCRTAHRTIGRVTEDLERRLHFNTAIAAIMELVNALGDFAATLEADDQQGRWALHTGVETAVILLGPFVPHVASELWEALGHRDGLDTHAWPEPAPALLAEDEVLVVVQVDGRVRGRVRVPTGAGTSDVVAAALQDTGVQRYVHGRPIRRTVVVPDRLVNLVLE